jgi:hypothetical protein
MVKRGESDHESTAYFYEEVLRICVRTLPFLWVMLHSPALSLPRYYIIVLL